MIFYAAILDHLGSRWLKSDIKRRLDVIRYWSNQTVTVNYKRKKSSQVLLSDSISLGGERLPAGGMLLKKEKASMDL